MNDSLFVCKNCQHTFSGKFCNNCGEKVYTATDKSIKHLFEEFFHFITHFEGSFLTTIKTVFTRPGRFSLDYTNGIRKKYFKPVSLFLLLVILYLLFPRFKGLNMQLDTYVTDNYDFTWVSVPLIKKKMKETSSNYAAVAKRYDSKSPAVSKFGLFILIPLSAGVLAGLFFTSKKYYFDHCILSLELSSVYVAIHFLIIPFASFIAELINKNWIRFFWDDNYWLGGFVALLDLLIVTIAFKRFYNQKLIWTIPKAIIFVLVFGEAVIYLYRLLVLVVTLLLS